MKALRTQHNYLEVIWMLAKTDLKMRYNGSMLGIVWVFLKPFMIFLVLNFVFSHLFANGETYFSLKLLTGLILWSFFAEATMQGLTSLVAKAHILKKISIPKWTVIVASTVHSLLAFLFNLVILIFFFLLYGVLPSLGELGIGFLFVAAIYVISLSFSFCTASFFVKFRDVSQIWEVLLQVLFYAAPIIYPITIIPAAYRWVIYINPMAFIIQHVKAIVIDHSVVHLDHQLIFGGAVVVMLVCALVVLRFSSRNVIEQL